MRSISPQRIYKWIDHQRNNTPSDNNNKTSNKNERSNSPMNYFSPNPKLERRITKSLDSSEYSMNNIESSNHVINSDIRSLSADHQINVMNRLNFENIDLLNTPLSSLRSCSEYNKDYINKDEINFKNKEIQESNKSIFSNLFNWNSSTKKNNVRFNSDENHVYMIERLQFNEANLKEGEDYNYSVSSNSNKSRFTSTTSSTTITSSSSKRLNSTILNKTSENRTNTKVSSVPIGEQNTNHNSRTRNVSTTLLSSPNIVGNKKKNQKVMKQPKRKQNTFLRESSNTFDYIFGMSSKNKILPMEIELKTFGEPQLLTIYEEHSYRGISIRNENHQNNNITMNEQNEIYSIRTVSSFASLHSTDRSIPNSRRSSHSQHSSVHSCLNNTIEVFVLYKPNTWMPYIKDYLLVYCIAWLRSVYIRYIQSVSEDTFYESIRMQPFSSGSYLRGMLSAGFCNTVFNIYNIISWPEINNLSNSHVYLENGLFMFVILQTLFNLSLLPSRLQINYLCWESARVVESDLANHYLRTMIHSDSWVINRTLGTVLDIITIVMLVLCEIYLWTVVQVDPLKPLIISLSATNLLTYFIRILFATLFGLSMHDPDVLNDARRRGLSKYDLDVLPAFVYSSLDDVNNEDCSICLATFERGEMLTCLPCDGKHNFHTGCIRQWLQRQNACPLCQKII